MFNAAPMVEKFQLIINKKKKNHDTIKNELLKSNIGNIQILTLPIKLNFPPKVKKNVKIKSYICFSMFLLSFFIFLNSFIQLLEGEKIVECWKTLVSELPHEIQHDEISYKHSCGKGTLIFLSRLKTDNTHTERQFLISINSVSLLGSVLYQSSDHITFWTWPVLDQIVSLEMS